MRSFRVPIIATLLLVSLSATLRAGEVWRNDFRISSAGTDGSQASGASGPGVAYNSATNQFLVVWTNFHAGESEIYGQRINALTGAEVGTDFRISTMGPDGNGNFTAHSPAVAYNSVNNEWLVVWNGDDDTVELNDEEYEIFGRRVSAAGGLLGTDEFRISNMGTDGNPALGQATQPKVAYNNVDNDYMVVWTGTPGDPSTGEWEIYGQRLDGPDGAELGAQLTFSDIGTPGDASRDPINHPDVAYNSTNNQYLIVWAADDLAMDNEDEVFGQIVSNVGAEVGTNDFRISEMGATGNVNTRGYNVSVAYNVHQNEYFVVWNGNDFSGTLAQFEYEIWGQALSNTGAEVGTNDVRISHAGTDGDGSREALDPDVAYSVATRQYLVAWRADQGAQNDEIEIWGQRVSSTGNPRGPDKRLSDMGPDVDTNYGAFSQQIAFNASAAALVVWSGDDNVGTLVEGEQEIFGQLFTAAPPPRNDFIADPRSDLGVFRPSTNGWWIRPSGDGTASSTTFGQSGDIPVPGDYDGDGKGDIAVWRPSNGNWWIKGSLGTTTVTTFGLPTDIPVPGDYDGDERADIAVWRPSNGTWWVKITGGMGVTATPWGVSTDKPTPADFDGDGLTDLAVWRPSDGKWWVRGSLGSNFAPTWGVSTDLPIQGDYDGDGKADPAIWRPSTGTFWILNSSGGADVKVWGQNGDVPVVGDFDNDGKRDKAVWRPSTGVWWITRSSDSVATATNWGQNGDKPLGETRIE